MLTRILIVDDNAANLLLHREIFERQGYEVISARHGSAALEAARSTPPDLVISDILMPVMDGFALCREWQQDDRLKAIPFVFYTATYTTAEDQQLGLKLGAARYLIKPTPPPKLIEIVQAVLGEDAPARPVVTDQPADGETVFLKEYSETLIRKLESKVAQLEAANQALEQEIAERQLAEKALQAFTSRYELMFQKHVATMLLVDPETGDIVDANHAACTYYGYNHSELVAMNISDINILSEEQVHDEMQRAHAKQWSHFIVRHALATGEVRDVEVSSGPVEIEGKPLLYSIIHDITDRKQAEDALRASEEQHRRIFETVTDALLIAEFDATIIEVNPAACRLYGYEREEILGLNATDLSHPDYHHVLQQFVHSIRTAGAFSGETVGIRKNGEAFNAEVKGASVVFQGKPHLLAIVRDVTERKRAERRRVEFEMEKERTNVLQNFINNASHDLRTPLTTIKTHLYLLQKLTDSEKQQQYLTVLDTQTSHLERLFDDMLDMSRLDKEFAFKFRTLDLNAFVQDVIVRQMSVAKDKNLSITIDCDLAIPPMKADRTQLDGALTNILINALNYTPDGGTIAVRTYRWGDDAIIEVQDTGIGIGADDLPHIFDRFYRGDKARGTEKGGAGLGLAIARRIVEAHQGTIEVESEPGEGSTFRIYLPISNGID